jgi:hypothetical protein
MLVLRDSDGAELTVDADKELLVFRIVQPGAGAGEAAKIAECRVVIEEMSPFLSHLMTTTQTLYSEKHKRECGQCKEDES